jgi:hypothetical protein
MWEAEAAAEAASRPSLSLITILSYRSWRGHPFGRIYGRDIPMVERRVPARRRGREATARPTAVPLDFKARLAKATTLAAATDDGYLEVERDDRLDFCDVPMILERWEIRHADTTYNSKTHCRVWAVLQEPDKTEPTFIKFRDLNGDMGDQLAEMDRCGTHRDVAVIMDAREFAYGAGGMDVGYAFTFREMNPDGEHVPPAEEPPADDENPDF